MLIMAAVLGVGTLLGTVRAQRAAAGSDGSDLGRRTTIAAVTASALTAGSCIGAWLDSAPVAHHSSAGSPPAQGVIGMGVLIVSLIVLAVMMIAGRRQAASSRQPGAAASVRAGYRGSGSGTRVGALAAGAALMLGTAGVAAAHASRPVTGGVVHVYEAGTGGRTDTDVLTGAVGDHGSTTSVRSTTATSKHPVHDVKANVSVCRVAKRLRDRGQDLKAERAPQPDRRRVGFDDGVELHGTVAVGPCLIQHLAAQGTADAVAAVCRMDDKPCVGDMPSWAWVDGMGVGGPDDDSIVIDGHERPPGWLAHPPCAGAHFGSCRIPRQRATRGRSSPAARGFATWPATKWPWFGELTERGYTCVAVHRGNARRAPRTSAWNWASAARN
jgi:hypothetical protein